MKNQILKAVFIPLFIFQFYSCYSYKAITKQEFVNQNSKPTAQVLTKDLEIKKFPPNSYLIKRDTVYLYDLSDFSTRSANKNISPIYIIPLEDIETIMIETSNIGPIFLITLGILASTGIIYLITTLD